jgi:copper chaperone
MTQLVASVTGLTCQHCVNTVTSALEALPGVDTVSVELVNGGESAVTIDQSGDGDLMGSIAQALADEGYTLTSLTEGNN